MTFRSHLKMSRGWGSEKMWQFCSPCCNWNLFATTLVPPPFLWLLCLQTLTWAKVMWAYLSKLPSFLPKAFVNQIWSKLLPSMWWMLLFSHRQKGCPVSVLRQLVHYAVQVRGRRSLPVASFLEQKKIGITTEKIHFNSYFFISIPKKKESFWLCVWHPPPP